MLGIVTESYTRFGCVAEDGVVWAHHWERITASARNAVVNSASALDKVAGS